MNRRAFLKSVGVAAAAASVVGLPVLTASPAEVVVTATSAWAPATFHAGDIFTIAGHYVTNPTTGREIPGLLQTFVVTSTVESDSPDTTVNFMPRIKKLRKELRARDVQLCGWSA